MPVFENYDLERIYLAIGGGGGGVTSFNGRVGAVVSVGGDYNTSQVTEVTNLYFTEPRVYSSVIAAWAPAAGTIAIGDTLQTILQKLQGNISAIGGLTNWAESFSSATQASSQWTPLNAAANVNAVIKPKGTGAITAQIPDGGTGGGNSRGTNAVDFQFVRIFNTSIASGQYSVIVGGQRNTASGSQSSVLGGYTNVASGNNSVCLGGQQNNATASDSCVVAGYGNANSGADACLIGGYVNSVSNSYVFLGGGQSNVASGIHSFLGGGNDHDVTAQYGVICGGNTIDVTAVGGFAGGGALHLVSGQYASVPGGYANTASGNYSTASGIDALADKIGQIVQSGGKFGVQGDSQTSVTVMRKDTGAIGSTATSQLFTDGSAGLLFVTGTDKAMLIRVDVLATCVAIGSGALVKGDCRASYIEIIAKQNGGTLGLSYNFPNLISSDASMSTSSVTAAAVAGTPDSISLTFTAPTTANGSTFRITARVVVTEIGYT